MSQSFKCKLFTDSAIVYQVETDCPKCNTHLFGLRTEICWKCKAQLGSYDTLKTKKGLLLFHTKRQQ